MKILVSEMAKLYGLSNQAIHYYEHKRYVDPTRDLLNNYRYFEALDLRRLGGLKKYRNAEFSLDRAYKMCVSDDRESIVEQMVKQKKNLENQIKLKELIALQLEDKIQKQDLYHKIGNAPQVVTLEDQYILISYGKEIIYQDDVFKDEASHWFKNIFFTEACSVFDLRQKSERISRIAYGLIANEDVVNHFKLKLTSNVKRIEQGQYLRWLEVVNCDEDICQALDAIQLRLELDEKYKQRDQVVIRTLIASKNSEDEYELFVEILCPIFIK